MFFGEGRKALLEFLRNLTPQIIFLTLALLFGSKLNLNKFQFTIEGVSNFIPFFMSLIVFFGASMANITTFIDSAITSNESLNKEIEAIKGQNLKALRRTWNLICAAWKHNKSAFFQLVLALVVAEASFVAVFILAIQGAIASPFLQK